jgi:AraC family transcriptional regulator
VSVILEGRFVQRFPGRECDCPAGTVLAKPAGERHEDRWFTAGSRHLILEVDPLRHGELGGSRMMLEAIHHLPSLGSELIARRMLGELSHSDELSAVALEGLALELLAFLARRQTDAARGSRPAAWLRLVREYLHDNYRDPIRLDALARLAAVHPDHLARSFSAAFGQSVGDYLRRLRLEGAMGALAESDEPIAAIAHRFGFSDQSHLTRLLRRGTGVTPAAYRAAHRRGQEARCSA